jgi:hypothetical protein
VGDPLLAALADDGGQAAAGGPDVADPLPLAAGRDQVVPAVELQQVGGHAAGLARLAAPDLEHPAAPDADAAAGEELDRRVEHPAGEPAGLAVVGGGGVGHGSSSSVRGGIVRLMLLASIR